MSKLYTILEIIGAICFLIGDVLLGCVDCENVDKRAHLYISKGHESGYKRSKIAVTMTLAALGIPFFISRNAAYRRYCSG